MKKKIEEKKANKLNFKITLLVIVLIAVVTILSLSWYAYAKYITSLKGETSADIAQWNFNVTAGNSENLVIDLAKTRYSTDTYSVDRSTVAPGTSGELILNINANLTDVSLEYDIDLDISEVPQNLIFYSDSEMKNAFYHSNKNIHIDGFFDCNTEDKSEQKKIYWSWAIETGQTDAQIMQNNLLDSEFMGKNITLGIQVTGQQVKGDANLQETKVTFDANGGTIEGYGNSSQMTKSVSYGETYGELPIPTRDGYTFKGWNGKNLYDINNLPSRSKYYKSTGVSVESGDWITIETTKDNLYYNYWTYNLDLKEEIEYTIVMEIKDVSNLTGYLLLTSNHPNNDITYRGQFKNNYIYTEELMNNNIIIKKASIQKDIEVNYGLRTYYTNVNYNDNEKLTFRISVLENQDISASDFKYEPYYISESTQVTQNKDHKLTAIWEKN